MNSIGKDRARTALEVACPACGAPVGGLCRDGDRELRGSIHTVRLAVVPGSRERIEAAEERRRRKAARRLAEQSGRSP